MYSKMEDSPYQIDAGFQKTSTLCEFTRSGAIEDHLFSSLPLSDVFTGYGGWFGLVLYWFLTLSQISELLQWPNHVVCFFHCFNSSQRKNPQQPKKKVVDSMKLFYVQKILSTHFCQLKYQRNFSPPWELPWPAPHPPPESPVKVLVFKSAFW